MTVKLPSPRRHGGNPVRRLKHKVLFLGTCRCCGKDVNQVEGEIIWPCACPGAKKDNCPACCRCSTPGHCRCVKPMLVVLAARS